MNILDLKLYGMVDRKIQYDVHSKNEENLITVLKFQYLRNF